MSKSPTYGDAVRWLVEHTDRKVVLHPKQPWPALTLVPRSKVK